MSTCRKRSSRATACSVSSAVGKGGSQVDVVAAAAAAAAEEETEGGGEAPAGWSGDGSCRARFVRLGGAPAARRSRLSFPAVGSRRNHSGARKSNRKSEAPRTMQEHSEALGGTRKHSEALGSTRKHSEALGSTQKHSEALRRDGAPARGRGGGSPG